VATSASNSVQPEDSPEPWWACKPSNNDEAGQRGHQAFRRINLGALEHWAVGVGIWYPGPGEGVGSAPAAPAAANPMAAAAHRYSSTVAVERMSRRAVLTDPRKAYTADRTQTAIMTINIGSQLVRL
jgi:hypothetical protein